MSKETAVERHHSTNPKAKKSRRGLGATFPLLLGGIFTVGFYSLIPYIPVYQQLAERYFCSHPLEYATAGMFFVGIAILLVKALKLRSERAAISAGLLEATELSQSIDSVKTINLIEQKLKSVSGKLQHTFLVRRIQDVVAYVRGRKSSNDLEEHLKYLAELDSERLHGSYALVRTITWAVPILGFLGTVIGITIAIANVTPDQLDTSLSEVTGGLAVAFDTTALALTLSMFLVFGAFIVERAEQQILAEIEEYGIQRIACLFPDEKANTPIARAEAQAADELLKKTESLIDWQTGLWKESLEGLRQRWTETLGHQQSTFNESLKQGMTTTLNDHASQLASTRKEFQQGYESIAKQMTAQIAHLHQEQNSQQTENRKQMSELWKHIHNDFTSLSKEIQTQTSQTVKSMSQEVSTWNQGLKESNIAITEQLKEMRKQGESLLKIAGQEENLTRVQTQLNENLQAVKTAETMQETLLSLNAAIHLLTARTTTKAA